MDIDFLLALQNFRETTDNLFTPLATEITNFNTTFWLFGALAVVYWLIDKKAGLRLFVGCTSARVVLGFAKLFACVYRPWIRDARIMPEQAALKDATGYSFPSGHAVTAVSCYGGIAYWLWNKRRWISVCLIVLTLLTMISRNYCGVHTPQDVLVGGVIGLVFVLLSPYITNFLINCNLKKSLVVLLCVLAVAVALFVFYHVKPYPMDYVDGKLLVDPSVMMIDGCVGVGELVGLAFGWFVAQNFINYKIEPKSKAAILIVFVALIGLYFWDKLFVALFTPIMPVLWVKMLTRCLKMFYLLAVVPFCLKISNQKSKKLKEF